MRPFLPRFTCLLFLLIVASSALLSQTAASWPFAGQSITGQWSQPGETKLGTSSARTLAQKWVFTTGGDVSAIPTVQGTTVFFPDWAGNVYALNKSNGALVWQHTVTSYTGQSGDVSRVSPALYNGMVIFGDHINGLHDGARVVAVSQQTGQLLWATEVESHKAAIITGSPVVANGRVYIGISSGEEAAAVNDSYPCCTFRGSVVALDASTGAKLWQTYVMPSNGGAAGGYSGGAIWSAPAIDLTRNQLYVVTGNNYSVPASVESCQQANPNSSACTAANDYFDSALALDLTTGAVKWGKKLYGYDAFNSACKTAGSVNCPVPTGPDFDFGSGPNLIGNILGLGQKSGIYYALNPDTGALVWATVVGPGGASGGIVWGTATDGKRIYAGIGNKNAIAYPVFPTGANITWGSWTALDVATGKIIWQTPDPTPGTRDSGSLSIANGVLYAGSLDTAGHMYALNASTGQILWSFASGGSILGAPAIVDGTLYWGSGYSRSATGNNKLYAFGTSSNPVVNVSTPYQNMASNSPVRFTASMSTTCSTGVQYMRIYTSNSDSPFLTHTSSFNTTVSLSPGIYNTVVQSKDNCGRVAKTYVTINVVNCPPPSGASAVHFCAPGSGASVSSAFQVTGSSNLSGSTTTRLYVDGKSFASVKGNVFSQLIQLPTGSHRLTLQAVDSAGALYSSTRNITVQ
jgi:polyvinyl alcohol dehydrogenase (cytochrome)